MNNDTEVISFTDATTAMSELQYRSIKQYRNGGKYPDTPEGLELFKDRCEQYFAYVRTANQSIDGKKVIADLEGLYTSLGISRTTASKYYKRGGEWQNYLQYVKDLILAGKKQGMLSGQIPPIAAIFDMTNNHQYLNSSAFTPRQLAPDATVKQGLTVSELYRVVDNNKQEV